jgi:internalin A
MLHMWKGVTLVTAGILAFIVGVWCFAPAAPSPAAVSAPDPPPMEVPPATTDAILPLSPPAETDETPATAPSALTPPNTPETANPRLTRANFDLIANGMTEEQVKVLLGNPTAAKLKTNPTRRALQWAQRKPFAVIEVEFINGLSAAKTTTLVPAAPPPDPAVTSTKPPNPAPVYAGWGKMTRANFELIKNGMTEDEVRAIFGPPKGTASRTTTMEGNTFRQKTLMWSHYQPDLTLKITVTIRNEKVSGKNWIQIGPAVPPPTVARVDEAEDRSVAFVKKLGGRVYRADYKPGRPVIGVDLVQSKITDAGLGQLAGLRELTKLQLHNTSIGDTGLQELAVFKQLQELTLDGTKISPAGLRALAGLNQLSWLGLGPKQINDATLETLRKMRMLHALSATSSKIYGVRPTGPDEVVGMYLSGSQVTDSGLKELVEFPKLDTLWLNETWISDTGLKELARFELKFLYLSKTPISNAGLKELAAHRQLKTLWLESTRITDSGLKQLAAGNLEELRLGDTSIGDAGLKQVAAHKQLQTLMLERTFVTNAGMKELAGLTQLRSLDLANTRIGDAGVRELQTLQQLAKLHLSFTEVSKSGLAELKKALPRCEIVHNTAK